MMRGLAKYFREKSHLSILLQGETSKLKLLEQFIKKHSVWWQLLAFWEGVDVRGDALSLSRSDRTFTYVLQKINRRLDKRNRQHRIVVYKVTIHSNDIQIPEAVIALKQGVGRCPIRDVYKS